MKIFFTILFTFLMISCKSSSTVTEQNDSKKSISWIDEKIEKFKTYPPKRKAAITEYMYNGEIVYLVQNCYKCPDAQSFLYNKKQEKLCTFGGMVPSKNNNCTDFFNTAKVRKIIWKNF